MSDYDRWQINVKCKIHSYKLRNISSFIREQLFLYVLKPIEYTSLNDFHLALFWTPYFQPINKDFAVIVFIYAITQHCVSYQNDLLIWTNMKHVSYEYIDQLLKCYAWGRKGKKQILWNIIVELNAIFYYVFFLEESS